MTGLKTDPNLLNALKNAAGKKLSASQVRKQKISFILGSLGKDSTITREIVEREVKKNEGEAA